MTISVPRIRPTFASIYLSHARELSDRSTCSRLHVGAVITSQDHRHPIAIGYNGNGAGLPNGCDSEEPGACGCVHAEANAIAKCSSLASEPKIFYITHAPCVACAKLIINLGGVKEVAYVEAYRVTRGLDVLTQAGIPHRQHSYRVPLSSIGDENPVPTILSCPKCGMQHIDRGEWATPERAHRTHRCEGCEHEWKPFPVATIGVAMFGPVIREAPR